MVLSDNLGATGDENPEAEALLWRLCAKADVYGTLRADPLRRLKLEVAGTRANLSLEDFASALDTLERHDLIVRYIVGGVGYVHICNFIKHQTCRWARMGKPDYPPPPDWKPPPNLVKYIESAKENPEEYYLDDTYSLLLQESDYSRSTPADNLRTPGLTKSTPGAVPECAKPPADADTDADADTNADTERKDVTSDRVTKEGKENGNNLSLSDKKGTAKPLVPGPPDPLPEYSPDELGLRQLLMEQLAPNYSGYVTRFVGLGIELCNLADNALVPEILIETIREHPFSPSVGVLPWWDKAVRRAIAESESGPTVLQLQSEAMAKAVETEAAAMTPEDKERAEAARKEAVQQWENAKGRAEDDRRPGISTGQESMRGQE